MFSHFLIRNSCRVWDDGTKNFGRAVHASNDNIIRRMRISCWVTKAGNPHPGYVILISFFLVRSVKRAWRVVNLVPLSPNCEIKNKRNVRTPPPHHYTFVTWSVTTLPFTENTWDRPVYTCCSVSFVRNKFSKILVPFCSWAINRLKPTGYVMHQQV